MSPILGTGLSGLVGSRIVELNSDLQFQDLSLDSGYDILKPTALESIFASNSAPVVLHFAAFTDTNAAWLQNKDRGGLCYQLNVVGTQNVVDLCRRHHKHLIHISTDFVFDGTASGAYVEADIPHPIEWYGATKYQAEQIVTSIPSTIVRISYPYRAQFDPKPDLVRKLLSKLRQGDTLKLFTDQITTLTYVDDIALGLRRIIDSPQTGIFHLVGSSSQSPYELGQLLASTFGYDPSLIQPSLLSDYVASQPVGSRPWQVNLALSNQKFIDTYHYTPLSLKDGLLALKELLSLLL